MSETPLFDATLADVLARARRGAERRVEQAERAAAARVEAAERRAAAAEREYRVRQAVLEEQAEHRRQDSLRRNAELRLDLDEEPLDRSAPEVPSVADLMVATPGITHFLDSLLGPAERERREMPYR